MNPFPIDAYAYANRLRWIHPGEKLLFAGATLLVCLYFRSAAVSLAALLLLSVGLSRVAGIPLAVFWRFLRVPAGFIALGVLGITVVAVSPGAPGTLVALPVGPWAVGVTAGSLAQGVGVLAASAGCVASTLFLALTTPIVDITDQLRRWHVPVLFVDLMLLVYRFIFVLLETAHAMHVAQEARLGYSTPRRALRSVGMLASNLYLRANARAKALYTALTARGYTGDLRVLMERPAWSARHVATILALDAGLLVVGLAARLALPGGLA
jgi:cobalt/nickel transport system permease protein